MKTYFIIGALLLCDASEPVPQAANTIAELQQQLVACIKVQDEDRVEGEITVNFSIRRDGSIIGRPRITYLRPQLDMAKRQRVLEQIAESMARCFPASLTEGLGGAIAGHMFSWRIVIGNRERAI
jgi:hypothetical protein